MKANDKKKVNDKMNELMKPVDQQIMMCDDEKEVLMMACAMLQRVATIFDIQLGPTGRKEMFKTLV